MNAMPSKRRHYARPPIVEAVLDIRCGYAASTSAEVFAKFLAAHQAAFPEPKDVHSYVAEVTMRPGGASPETAGKATHDGQMATSSDRLEVVRATKQGFRFSRLTPYAGWEAFESRAKQLWASFRALTNPDKITRLGIRTVNRLDLPMPFGDFSDYFQTYPLVGPQLPQELHGFLMRFQSAYADIEGKLLFTQTAVPSDKQGHVAIILDIDLFREDNVPQDDESLWTLLSVMRDRKDEAFEACITDKSRELFK